jgi:hypothetical protein
MMIEHDATLVIDEHLIVGQLRKVVSLAERPQYPTQFIAATLATKFKTSRIYQ